MEIFLVRHGIAEDHSKAEERGEGDSGRRLTSEGREKTAKVAHAFRKQITSVDVIFHSPYARAVETAEIFSREFPKAQLKKVAGLTPEDGVGSALSLLEQGSKEARLMIVGHEPHLSSLASVLLTGKDVPILEFKRAGIACIECFGSLRDCRLNFLLSPKWL